MANKKQRDTAAEDEELKARKAALAEKENKEPAEKDDGPADILASAEDEDIIF